jgi:transcriptional regulator NrdR family protein
MKPWQYKKCECENSNRIFNSKTIDSRKRTLRRKELDIIWRRRECNFCQGRFTTYEINTMDLNFE